MLTVSEIDLPFARVSGRSLAEACEPKPEALLPDYCLFPAPDGILVLVPAGLVDLVGSVEAEENDFAGPDSRPPDLLLVRDVRLSAG